MNEHNECCNPPESSLRATSGPAPPHPTSRVTVQSEVSHSNIFGWIVDAQLLPHQILLVYSLCECFLKEYNVETSEIACPERYLPFREPWISDGSQTLPIAL